MSTPNTKHHECPKSQCMCSETDELKNCYRELKRSHRNAIEKVENEQRYGVEFRFKKEECDESLCNDSLSVVKSQRKITSKMLETLEELNERLCKQEDTALLFEKEIEDLRNQIRLIKNEFDSNKSMLKSINQTNKKIRVEEDCWRMAVEMEVKEQRRLKEKIKEEHGYLETQISEENLINEEIQKERKKDTALLLDAVNYVEECLNNCKIIDRKNAN